MVLIGFYSSLTIFAELALIRLLLLKLSVLLDPRRVMTGAIAVSWLVTLGFLGVHNSIRYPDYNAYPGPSAVQSAVIVLVGLGTLLTNLYILAKVRVHEARMREVDSGHTLRTEHLSTDTTPHPSVNHRPSTENDHLLANHHTYPANHQTSSASVTALILFLNTFVCSLYVLALNAYFLYLFSTGNTCPSELAPDGEAVTSREMVMTSHEQVMTSYDWLHFFVCAKAGRHELELVFLLAQSLVNNMVLLLQKGSREVMQDWLLELVVRMDWVREESYEYT